MRTKRRGKVLPVFLHGNFQSLGILIRSDVAAELKVRTIIFEDRAVLIDLAGIRFAARAPAKNEAVIARWPRGRRGP